MPKEQRNLSIAFPTNNLALRSALEDEHARTYYDHRLTFNSWIVRILDDFLKELTNAA